MKIGIYVGSLDPKIGGGYSYTKAIIDVLKKKGTAHQFVFIVDGESNTESGININDGSVITYKPIHHKPSIFHRVLNKILKNSRSWKALYKIYLRHLDEESTSINEQLLEKLVHDHNIDLIYYPSNMQCLSKQIPYVTTFWDLGHLTISPFPEVTNNGVFEQREKWYREHLGRALAIFSESEAGKSQLLKYYAVRESKVHVVPLFPGEVINYKVTKDQQEAFLQEQGLEKGKFLFYPAQFWAHKNHINLLKALHWLKKEKGIVIKLALSGSDQGNYPRVLQTIKDLGLENQVKMLGFISNEEVYTLYINALALPMITFLGPTNMPPLEAIHLGCPVICSDFDGHKELLGDAALYTDPANFKAIGEKILLIQDPEIRDKLIKTGLERAKTSENTIEVACTRIDEAFNKLAPIRECW